MSTKHLHLLIVLAAVPGMATAQPAFRVYTDQTGVYRLDYERLAAAGLEETGLATSGIALSNQGSPVPIWVRDDDGVFGPGDTIEFLGEHLPGDSAYHHEHARFNVYQLRLDAAESLRMTPRQGRLPQDATPRHRLRGRQHLEADKLFIRVSGFDIQSSGDAELWYWAKLTHIDPEPLAIELDLTDLDPAGGPVVLEAHFRALSRPRARHQGVADHRLKISLNGQRLARAEWDGKTTHLLALDNLDAARFAVGPNKLELRVPKRVPEGTQGPLIDVVMLNWIEIRYPLTNRPGRRRIELAEPAAGQVVELTAEGQGDWIAYANGGGRIEPARAGARLAFESAAGEETYFVADPDRLLAPAVELDRPSDLARRDRRADYLMITHPRLAAAIEPLAELHRQRGLEVAVIDIRDVYDEFGHGILHPRALRDFVAHAYHHWRKPAPRFVLLVGDASWDTKNATVDDANYANWTDQQLFDGDRFVARDMPLYPETVNRRNLIPTWNYHSGHGHSASDNYFVSVDGEDFLPDLAIGRLPVAEPEEVRAIVEKTVRYVTRPRVGPWRRDVLWITNEMKGFQNRSDQLVGKLDELGFGSLKVYPEASEKDNVLHQAVLQEAFNRGQALVHFFGHGGRHIWRTGPPDFRKNHDLFTLRHIEDLEPNDRLPLVLSMTCFSAPFDHPNADSIGEKFLRVAERGAIAVFAASWRNSPSIQLSEKLIADLVVPGTPIGTAILATKRAVRNRNLVETYNLLGDPAIALAVPAAAIRIAPLESPAAAAVSATFDLPGFAGRAIVDWLDGAGKVLASDTFAVAGPSFRASYSGDGRPASVRIYAWSEEAGIDGAGALRLPSKETVYSNTLKWSTASELDNFGYDVYRGDSEDGPFERINPEPIPGAGTTDEPSYYEYVDDTIDPHEAYWYYVESISMSGDRDRFTPIYPAKPKLEREPSEATADEEGPDG